MILPSTLLEFACLAIDGFMDANCLAPLIDKGNWLPPPKKKSCGLWVRKVYTMENKDTDTEIC